MGCKTRLQKEEHWNDKGWAQGGCKTILEKHVTEYTVEWEKGPVAEQAFIAKVYLEYHHYIHRTWGDDIELAQLFTLYDPNMAPEIEILTEEEQARKREHIKVLNDMTDVVDKEWQEKMAIEYTPLQKCNLSKEEKEKWVQEAKTEAAVAKKRYEEQLKTAPSTNPAVCPIIEGVRIATGCHVFVAVGGPMTLFDREISTMNITVGKNLGPIPIPFPFWKANKFMEFMDFYVNYLETAYMEADKEAAAMACQGTPNWNLLLRMDVDSSETSKKRPLNDGNREGHQGDNRPDEKFEGAKGYAKAALKGTEWEAEGEVNILPPVDAMDVNEPINDSKKMSEETGITMSSAMQDISEDVLANPTTPTPIMKPPTPVNNMPQDKIGSSVKEAAVELLSSVFLGAPEWVEEAAVKLGKMNLGDDFMDLLKNFVRLETIWRDLKHIRAGPQAKELGEFRGTWLCWWKAMQPEWRATTGNVTEWGKVADGNWSSLQLLGLNGFLGIVASLAWWGIAAKVKGRDKVKGWMDILRDIA
ncbi:hypothetical protein EDD85DRAFT_1001682 [Armillaria nabsnona]|nr:hypothetical protein EDD85DRAFT_1001682 [Armillaria nabsnona]